MAPLETSAKKWLQPGLDSWPLLSFLESSRRSFQLCAITPHLLNGLRQVRGSGHPATPGCGHPCAWAGREQDSGGVGFDPWGGVEKWVLYAA